MLDMQVRPINFIALQRLLIRLIILVGILMSFAACQNSDTALSVQQSTASDVTVDPVFREFYERFGGMEILGPPISNLVPYQHKQYQYTQAALMVLDPGQPDALRYHFAPLGLEMGIHERKVAPLEGARYVEGHHIGPEFIPMYEMLGGIRYVGRPLTEVHYNPILKRREQYFANLGMYIMDDDPARQVRLLAYGAWKCDANCRQVPAGDAIILLPHATDALFKAAVDRLGDDLTGFALSDSYSTPDGYIEQVFENIVLVADPNQPGRVFLRPITKSIGILPDPFTEPLGDPEYIFYPVQGEHRGYNVLRRFMEYIALHGGEEASGPPISELTHWKENIYRQCFTNLCLEEERRASGAYRIRPSQLGYVYKSIPDPEPLDLPEEVETQVANVNEIAEESQPVDPKLKPNDIEVDKTPTVEFFSDLGGTREVVLQVWESYPLIAPGLSQEIGVRVVENGEPVKGIEPNLVVSLPEGRQKTYFMYATGEDGQTILLIDPIDAPGGTVISYQVCIVYPGGQQFCVKDSFVIGNTL